MEGRTCARCQTTKPLSGFYVLKSGPRAGRVQAYCRACQNAAARQRSADPAVRARTAAAARARYAADPEKVLRQNRLWASNNRGKGERTKRDRYYRATYGISVDQYDALLAAQGGGCAVCGSTASITIGGRSVRLAVDHCHETGVVRGIVCDPCNRAAGCVRNDPTIAAALAVYLER